MQECKVAPADADEMLNKCLTLCPAWCCTWQTQRADCQIRSHDLSTKTQPCHVLLKVSVDRM